MEMANLPDKRKPATGGEEAEEAAAGSSGVKGGGAHGRKSIGTWETQRLGGRPTKLGQGINNLRGDRLGVGRVHSSEEAA